MQCHHSLHTRLLLFEISPYRPSLASRPVDMAFTSFHFLRCVIAFQLMRGTSKLCILCATSKAPPSRPCHFASSGNNNHFLAFSVIYATDGFHKASTCSNIKASPSIQKDPSRHLIYTASAFYNEASFGSHSDAARCPRSLASI